MLDVLEGEGTYLNQMVAYPAIQESQMLFIEISNKTGRFGVSRYPNDRGNFLFHYYVDGQEGAIPYTPPIVNAEGSFDYESLYAIETADGFGRIYYLSYLCSALGAPYFTERIQLPSTDTAEGAAQREALLKEYGLTKSESTMVSFEYGKRDSETGSIIEDSEEVHVLVIGDKALSGIGYYFMVDGRDYVYYTKSEYFSYALKGFGSFINGMLVSEGIDGESVYGPYLTTDFKTWTGTVFKEESDRVFTNDMDGYKKYENPTVVAKGSYKVSVDKGIDYVPASSAFNGYEENESTDLKFDLEALKSHPEYARIKNAFVGKNVGEQSDKITLTLLTELHNADGKLIDFGSSDTVDYRYDVIAIESVITDSGEITAGTVDSSSELIKITYRYTVGGVTVGYDCHGVIDVTSLADSEAAKFVGKTIGSPLGSDAFSLNVSYTKEDALSSEEKYVLTGILSIFNSNGAVVDAVTEDTYVNISYYLVVGGKKGDVVTSIVKLADIKDGDRLAPLKTILLGKGKGSYDEVVYNENYYYELVREFSTYEISEIKYLIANEMIVSFAFCNASERDPFFGDTFYKNTLTNEYRLYGLNAGTCEAAVKLLGGVGTDSNSAVGLSGETVAIGLSVANMEKYGLYAHKIYFEMPRGIYDASEGLESDEQDELSDYDWLRTLGFTLYVSDATYDENGVRVRYIGSDMYDIVAKVTSDEFDFLEYGFVEFWARKNMVMMDITKLSQLKLEFEMADLAGDYTFDVSFVDAYGAYVNGEYVISEEKFSGAEPFEHEIIRVKASGDAFDTAFKQRFGTGWGDLATVYNETLGGGKASYYPGSRTTLGAAYFNNVYETLQLTAYLEDLTEAEQAAGFASPRIMRMHLKVEGKEYYYTYDFYRIDDRRIMVSLYRSDADGNKIEHLGEVSDFYITTFAFKKLVNNYVHLLNGMEVDETVHYPS